jgi:hypothetical protein
LASRLIGRLFISFSLAHWKLAWISCRSFRSWPLPPFRMTSNRSPFFRSYPSSCASRYGATKPVDLGSLHWRVNGGSMTQAKEIPQAKVKPLHFCIPASKPARKVWSITLHVQSVALTRLVFTVLLVCSQS